MAGAELRAITALEASRRDDRLKDLTSRRPGCLARAGLPGEIGDELTVSTAKTSRATGRDQRRGPHASPLPGGCQPELNQIELEPDAASPGR